MKNIFLKTLVLFLAIFVCQSCIAQQKLSIIKDENTNKNTNVDVNKDSRTFQVCKVEKAKKPLSSQPYQDIIKRKTVELENQNAKQDAQRKLWKERQTNSDAELEEVPLRTLEAAANKDIELVATSFHPFVATLHRAYAMHYPVTISPDMIWLLIAQGFANHVNENGEEMRGYFVDFEGKKNLDVRRDGFVKGSPNNDWQGVFAEFSVQIQENTGADLLELVTGDFSTTTAIEKAAFQVTLMDAMKSYFTYSVTTMCGIPEITLEGTVEDWQMIEVKTQELAQYDLEGWVDELMPILKQFTAASKGKVDKNFWESIYKLKTYGSGSPDITGWILKFFPYMKRKGELVPFALKLSDKADYQLITTTSQFTSGLSKADFIWNYGGRFYSMELMAGFVGFHQDPETLSLRPEISWAVIDKNEKPSDELIESYHKGGDKEYLKSKKKQ